MQLSPALAPAQTAPLPSGNRMIWISCAFFALLVLLGNPNYQWSDVRESPFGADFVQEWVAGDMLLSGAAERLYDRAAFDAWQHDAERLGFSWPAAQYYPAVYPPPYYCLTAPLALLPYRTAAVAWLLLLVSAYAAAACLAIRSPVLSTAPHLPTQSQRASQWLWCIGLLMPAMFFSCVLGQKGSLWLLVISASACLMTHGRPWVAGCVAALLTLKPTLCTLIPLAMLFSGQWRFCFGFFTTTLVIYAGSACILPLSLWNNYLQIVLGASEYQASAGYRSGWSTSAMTLLMSVGVPKIVSFVVMAIGAVGLLAGCAARFGRRRDRSPLTEPLWQWQLLAGTLLLSPHAYFYDLVWLLLPASQWMATQPRRAVISLALVWIGMLLGQSLEHGPALPAVGLLLSLVYNLSSELRASCPVTRSR